MVPANQVTKEWWNVKVGSRIAALLQPDRHGTVTDLSLLKGKALVQWDDGELHEVEMRYLEVVLE